MKLTKTLCLAILAMAGWVFGLTAEDKAAASKKTGTAAEVQPRQLELLPARDQDTLSLGISPATKMPEDLKKMVEQFRVQADVYVAAQKELSKQLKGASTEEREKVKDQLKTNREKFLEDTKQLQTEIRERVKELREKLRDSRPVDAGLGENRGKGRRGGD